MLTLSKNLKLDHCPHCSIANPNLFLNQWIETNNSNGTRSRLWGIYVCGGCGGIVSAYSKTQSGEVLGHYPSSEGVEEDIAPKPRELLRQARNSFHAPAGSIMLSASAVDAMLKIKGLVDGSLYKRIEDAAAQHIITQDMSEWAHEVRLDANDQRHADENAELPSEADAKRVFDFAISLAEIMFVLPARVQRGLDAKPE
jgi:hypothetical protein